MARPKRPDHGYEPSSRDGVGERLKRGHPLAAQLETLADAVDRDHLVIRSCQPFLPIHGGPSSRSKPLAVTSERFWSVTSQVML